MGSGKHYACKGQWMSNEVKPYTGGPYLTKTDHVKKIPRESMLYLNKIRDTCKKNHITLVLVQFPSAISWKTEKHNAVQDYADENGLCFLDLDEKQSEFGLNWATDTRDGGNHLNCSGARKVTLYLANYFAENFKLQDHRKNKTYAAWNDDYKVYLSET
jgi:hypothetical protein